MVKGVGKLEEAAPKVETGKVAAGQVEDGGEAGKDGEGGIDSSGIGSLAALL